MKYNFEINQLYSRVDIKKKIQVPDPEARGGIWDTGYNFFDNCFFIFSTLESSGRTGHDYNNVLKDNKLYWYGKGNHSFESDSIQKMLSGDFDLYIFTRKKNSSTQFTFQGLGELLYYEVGSPVHIVWGINSTSTPISKTKFETRKAFIEGTKTSGLLTKYERNPKARQACLDYYGYSCNICEMKFEDMYGDIGKDFIHVHHIIELSCIGKTYEIDPIKDLIPVCPNCHAMFHKAKPAFTPSELKSIVIKSGNKIAQ